MDHTRPRLLHHFQAQDYEGTSNRSRHDPERAVRHTRPLHDANRSHRGGIHHARHGERRDSPRRSLERLQGCGSVAEKDHYLESWLAHIIPEEPPPPGHHPRSPQPKSEAPDKARPDPRAPRNPASSSDGVDVTLVARTHGGPKVDYGQQNPEEAPRPAAGPDKDGCYGPLSGPGAEPYYERGKKRTISLGDTGTELHQGPTQPDRRYEKRARRKTREDKYKTSRPQNGSNRLPRRGPSVNSVERQSGSIKPKKATKKRIPIPAREVMDHFTSEAIHNDRLTVPTSLTPGLFGNGRASTLCPLADLEFEGARLPLGSNEMENSHLGSCHAKQLRQEGQVEEMSTFFLPKDMREKGGAEQESGHTPSHDVAEGSELGSPATGTPRIELSYNSGTQEGQDHGAVCHDHFYDVDDFQSPRRSDDNKVTAHSTCSRCCYSSGLQRAPSSLLSNRGDQSPTPDEVRKAILETGVFNGVEDMSCRENGRSTQWRAVDDPKQQSASSNNLAGKPALPRPHIVRYQDRGIMVGEEFLNGIKSPNLVRAEPLAENNQPSQTSRSHPPPDSGEERQELRVTVSETAHIGNSVSNKGKNPQVSRTEVAEKAYLGKKATRLEPPSRPSSPKSHHVERLERQAELAQISNFESRRDVSVVSNPLYSRDRITGPLEYAWPIESSFEPRTHERAAQLVHEPLSSESPIGAMTDSQFQLYGQAGSHPHIFVKSWGKPQTSYEDSGSSNCLPSAEYAFEAHQVCRNQQAYCEMRHPRTASQDESIAEYIRRIEQEVLEDPGPPILSEAPYYGRPGDLGQGGWEVTPDLGPREAVDIEGGPWRVSPLRYTPDGYDRLSGTSSRVPWVPETNSSGIPPQDQSGTAGMSNFWRPNQYLV